MSLKIELTVFMKNTMFLAKTSCSPLKVNGLFGETYRLQLQRRRIRQARNQREAATLVSCLAYSSTLKIETIYSSETSMDI
jgi:hypothetical protein